MRRATLAISRALFELDESRLSPPRRALLVPARLAYLVVHAFFREHLQMRAAALAFVTLLAMVPAAAIAFWAADLVGATELLENETIVPFLNDVFGAADDPELPRGVRGLRSTLDSLVALVRDTDLTGLGIAGVVALLLAIARVLLGAEEAFEHIFGHRGPPRPLLVRARAFLIVALVTPLGLTYAVTGAALSHGHVLPELLAMVVPFEAARDLLIFVAPPIVVSITFYALYVELPDVEVERRSAWLGAILAGLAWYGVQLLHVRFQVSLGRWNAIYSGFGAFPVLMLSVHLSWVVVLLGAQVVAAHQNAPTLRQLARGGLRDHREAQALALRAMVSLRTGEWQGTRALAAALDAGITDTREVLDRLAEHGLLTVRVDRRDRAYRLRADPTTLRAGAVLDALERDAREPALPWSDEDKAVLSTIASLSGAAEASTANLTIAELASEAERPAADETVVDP